MSYCYVVIVYDFYTSPYRVCYLSYKLTRDRVLKHNVYYFMITDQ